MKAIAALCPTAELPADALGCLFVLLRNPHDYSSDAWETTVRRHGGGAAILRLLGPKLFERKLAQTFTGRRKGAALLGVAVGSPRAGVQEVLDTGGDLWLVRRDQSVLCRGRRAWQWERATAERIEGSLAGVVGEVMAGEPG